MNYLFRPVFKTVLKRKETWLCVGFSAFPLLLLLVDFFSTNFMQLSAPKGSLSFLEFFGAVESVQYQLTLPIIAFIYLVVTCFHDEIKSGKMFLFKDIKRSKILNAKIASVIGVYFIYFILTFVASLITYYLHLIHMDYTSGTFLPTQLVDLQDAIISIIGIFAVTQLCILISVAISIKLSDGLTMLIGIVFALISFIAPSLKGLKYFLPNGYSGLLVQLGFGTSLFMIVLLFCIYALIIYLCSNRAFKKMEY
ncbi:abc-type sugar transport system, permease component [Paucilactobacillus oligofermentans DSM 15707 = LMG 22743]|uniref:Abc-type sugar transport system, permease component n=1 Tax=Paucilactobacillus oligofermentans DSM 15707 = LMG 22743 TaxID=1423778 RepID=A0A0R1RNR0_9LACO|nr:hypothetical protein [Paucilactobacillus oligofermentans]KRL55685.1 abc-type sugar transport system, permease component [Paucilactobacillus oligofermentans DSM 15707 = LMG 22743]CUS25325.1 ABC-2 family transporter [Paucilactobacillus oligofermentans DSM 15707 = LMG 22743]